MAAARRVDLEVRSVAVTDNDPHILQAGVPKSGNLWLYNILSSVLDLAGAQKRSFVLDYRAFVEPTGIQPREKLFGHDVLDLEDDGAYARVNRFSRLRIYEPARYVESCTHVWTHSPVGEHGREFLPLFDSVVYIVRDPRDAAISQSHYVFTPKRTQDIDAPADSPDEFLSHRLRPLIRRWVQNVSSYLEHARTFDVYFLFYERLLTNFDEELDRLLFYLDIDLPEEARAEIKRRTSFETMQQRNADHVRRGEAYKWREALTASQMRAAHRIAEPLLELLQYPLDPTLEDPPLPRLPREIPDDTLRDARRHAKRFGDAAWRRLGAKLRGMVS